MRDESLESLRREMLANFETLQAILRERETRTQDQTQHLTRIEDALVTLSDHVRTIDLRVVTIEARAKPTSGAATVSEKGRTERWQLIVIAVLTLLSMLFRVPVPSSLPQLPPLPAPAPRDEKKHD